MFKHFKFCKQTSFCIEMILSFSGFFTATWLELGKMEEKRIINVCFIASILARSL